MTQSDFLIDLKAAFGGDPAEPDEPQTSSELAALYSGALVERYRAGNTSAFERIFEIVEHHLIFGTEDDQQLVIVGFLENLKNVCAWTDLDYVVFEEWLGPESHSAWRWLEKRWQGKRSLASTARDAGSVNEDQ